MTAPSVLVGVVGVVELDRILGEVDLSAEQRVLEYNARVA